MDSVDVECATQRRIAVINAPTSNADSVAELVVALFLMLSRMLYEANVKSREGSFEKKAPANFRGLEMNGKVFGQIGMGNIAQRVARIMHNGFGCKVLGYDPFISAEDALYDCLVSGQLRAPPAIPSLTESLSARATSCSHCAISALRPIWAAIRRRPCKKPVCRS